MHALFLNPRVRLWPDDPAAFHRGWRAAQAGDWPRAVRAFQLAVHQPATPGAARVELLLAEVAAGRHAEAQKTISDIFRLLPSVTDGPLRSRLLEHALHLACDEPTAVALLKRTAADLAHRRTAATLYYHGVALYRAGRYDEAGKVLVASVAAHGKGGYVNTWLFQSLVARAQGKQDEAGKHLARVESWHARQRFGDWRQRVLWYALVREAHTPPRMPRAD
jgi:tetratricopeptide (TPR) repeat protein